MNATAAVAPTPIAADLAFVSQASADNSVNNDPDRDFASVFSHAGGKSSHKAADARSTDADSGGGQRPVGGKDLPPPPPAPAPAPSQSQSQTQSQSQAATGGTAADGPSATARSAATGGDGSSPASPPGPAGPAAAAGAASGSSTTNAANAATAGTSFYLQQPAGGEHGDDAPITGTAATAAIPDAKAAAASVRAAAIATATGIATTATTTTTADGISGPSAADAGHATATMVQTDAAVTGDTATTALSLAAAASSPAAAAAIANDAASAASAADPTASAADVSKTSADGATGPAAAATADAAGDTATATVAAAAQAAAATAAVAAATTGAPAAALAMSTAGLAAGAVPIARALPALVGAGGPDKHARSDTDGPVSADTSIAAVGTGQSGVTFDTSPTPILKVNAGVETPEFAQGLAERVSTMVDANLTGARLQVNPPQLGPIEVRIAVQGDHALVWLASHSAVTRDALESSSSKLREMLGAQGFAQVSVDISQRHFQERPAPSQLYDNAPAAESVAPTATVAGPAASRARLSAGALDAYA